MFNTATLALQFADYSGLKQRIDSDVRQRRETGTLGNLPCHSYPYYVCSCCCFFLLATLLFTFGLRVSVFLARDHTMLLVGEVIRRVAVPRYTQWLILEKKNRTHPIAPSIPRGGGDSSAGEQTVPSLQFSCTARDLQSKRWAYTCAGFAFLLPLFLFVSWLVCLYYCNNKIIQQSFPNQSPTVRKKYKMPSQMIQTVRLTPTTMCVYMLWVFPRLASAWITCELLSLAFVPCLLFLIFILSFFCSFLRLAGTI